MSSSVSDYMAIERSRPTRRGTRRRPPSREIEQRRPSAVYRAGLQRSFASMSVMARLRDARAVRR